MDDRQLMASIAGGDEAALQALLRRFTPLFLYILRPILPDERDREECLADISLRIWQGAGSFDGAKGSLNGWLTALTRNAALNRARAKGTEDAPLEDTVPHGDGSAEDEVLRRERQAGGYRGPAGVRAGAVLPEVLLLPVHRPDGRRAGPDGARGGGAAVPPAAKPAPTAGR